jgi:aspartyl-tRNA(Asn)/glutamyl-tRNA(Gln) amidotransferase subunit A
MSKTWFHLTACDLGREIDAGRINPVELAEAFLAEIDAHPHGARIYARTTPARARGEAMAAAARAKSGLRRGLLDGVPLSWKDNYDSAGVLTEAGTALLAGRIPTKDAAVLATATAGGTICLGKTHMTELAFSGLGLNPVTATPPCINDETAVPGGSTSGGATSVAYGLAPAAIGSDTGGSVRLPAAWNDLVGLKTSMGRLPMAGVVPLAETFDTIGPLAHSVEDCAALLGLLSGTKPPALQGASLTGTRLLVLETVALDHLRPGPAQGFDDALARLARAGAQITRLAFPAMADVIAAGAMIVTPDAWAAWREVIETAPHKMFPLILDRFRSGAAITAADYLAAWTRLRQLRADWARATAGADAVLLPTSPVLPPNADRMMNDPDFFVAENLLALRNTRIGNLLDQAALTLPTAVPSAGISLMVPPGQEERLLRLGAAAERALH